MKAYRMTAFKTAPQMVEIPIPEPTAGQVRIKLGGAGICQSDLHIIHRFDATMPRLNLWKSPSPSATKMPAGSTRSVPA